MSNYGQISNELWRNRRFLGLTPEARLAYIYLLSGPAMRPSGLFMVDPYSVGAAAYSPGSYLRDSGLKLLRELEDTGFVRYEEPVVWVYGMREHYEKQGEDVNEGLKYLVGQNIADSYLKHYDIDIDFDGAVTTSPLLNAFATVVGRDDILLLSDSEKRRINLVKQDPEDILKHFSRPDSWWYKHHWKGAEKNQWPTVNDVIENIGPAMSGQVSEPKVDYHDVASTLYAALRAPTVGETIEMIRNELPDDVAAKLLEHKRASQWRQVSTDRLKWEVIEALK